MNKIEYLYTCLGEELNEVGQCVSKIQRFGLNYICDPKKDPKATPLTHFVAEVVDVIAVFDLLLQEVPELRNAKSNLSEQVLAAMIKAKQERVKKYLNEHLQSQKT